MRAVCLVVLSACTFSKNVSPGAGDDVEPMNDASTVDASDELDDVAHIPKSVEDAFAATASVTITNATIETRSNGMAPAINVALPNGASLISSVQDDAAAREVAILKIDDLTVTDTLTMRGTRPFVII